MKNVHFTNIVWDTDGLVANLPTQAVLEMADDADIDLEGADALSDKFGFCVKSFETPHEYYVWCDGDCQNKTSSLEEAKKWRDEFIAQGRASWIVDDNGTYITDGEDKIPFNPSQSFESVAQAVALIHKQPDPVEALLAVVRANIEMDEYGFASECVREFPAGLPCGGNRPFIDQIAKSFEDFKAENLFIINVIETSISSEIDRFSELMDECADDLKSNLGSKAANAAGDDPEKQDEALIAAENWVCETISNATLESRIAAVLWVKGVEQGVALFPSATVSWPTPPASPLRQH